jgi:hypothetical protein
MTDESKIYPFTVDGYCASKHETVSHKYTYVRDGDIHTNTIANSFSLLKRGINGSFHRVPIKHLPRYLSEFEYHFNRRKRKGQPKPDAFSETLARMAKAKPMTFENLTAKE